MGETLWQGSDSTNFKTEFHEGCRSPLHPFMVKSIMLAIQSETVSLKKFISIEIVLDTWCVFAGFASYATPDGSHLNASAHHNPCTIT